MRPGQLRLNGTGLSFTSAPAGRQPCETDIAWQHVSELSLTPSEGSAGGRLTVITTDGQTVYWRIPAFGGLAALINVLSRLQEQHRELSS